jgi:hypothetical protein
MHVYAFLKVALEDYYRCRKYGKGYKKKEGGQMLLDTTPMKQVLFE